MILSGFKNVGTEKNNVFINDLYFITQNNNKNNYSILNNNFLSSGNWEINFRFQGTINQVKKYLSSKK
tara:strand:+ start:671 stop:874 length:204 start_codon:yes stop_codon:yes gene_type:complete